MPEPVGENGKAMQPIPDFLPESVHQALRDWEKPELDVEPWLDFISLGAVAAPGTSRLEQSQAIKKWVLDGLHCLTDEDSQAAELLRQRFFDAEPVYVLANQMNVSSSSIWQRQRQAIKALAYCLWREELEARDIKRAYILERLEIAQPVQLFGVADKQAALQELFETLGPPWVVAVDGIGGIGKTTLADWAVRQVAHRPLYTDIGWISARRNVYTLWGGLQEQPKHAALTFEQVLDSLLIQFGADTATRLPYERKLAQTRELFQSAPHLVVLDNLETAADYHKLVTQVQALVNPSRFLLTSRHSLRAFPGVYSLTLDQLSPSDSLDLVRHEAKSRGFAELAQAPDDTLLQIYQVVGGNPLALKLVVGQSFALPLPEVLKNLRLAQGQAVENLYRHLYWHSWQSLSDLARQVLVTMPLVAEQGGDLAQIVAMSQLPEETVVTALTELVQTSLVNKSGGLQSARFAIHQLTETFLAREVLKWQTDP